MQNLPSNICRCTLLEFKNVGKSSDSESPLTSLVFRRPVQLQRDQETLLVLSLTGGSSLVGFGGRKYVSETVATKEENEENEVLFTFEEYRQKQDVEGHFTNVERGLIERILFTTHME